MDFSLIMATYGQGKIPHIGEYIESLSNQEDFDGELELIIVDQNEDDSISEYIATQNVNYDIRVLKSNKRGLSVSRNIGIKLAKYRNLSFPDDDCLYPASTLSKVTSFFKDRPTVDIVCVDTRDTQTGEKLPYTSKMKGEVKVTQNDIFKAVTSISIFVKNSKDVVFDERLGLGAKFSSCEEFDYILQQISLGMSCFFTDKIHVLHPNHVTTKPQELIKKIQLHAPGHGAFFRKHFWKLPRSAFYYMIISPIGGMALYALQFNFVKTSLYYNFLKSRLKGFLNYGNN